MARHSLTGTMDGADFHTLKALLDWQVEMGADEAIGDVPVNRYEEPAERKKSAPAAAPAPIVAAEADPIAEARAAADAAESLEELAEAMAAYDHCDLKRGARQLVFSDGRPGARVMFVGEAPGRDEDRVGRPFVGQAGQLLDRMLAAIGLDRGHGQLERAIYITNVLPWRPPENREPTPEEIAMMKPFLERHIALAQPEVLVIVGNISCAALLGQRGITRLRGKWTEARGLPALPMFHPAYLLRNPAEKRQAWHDLLLLQERLREAG